MAELSPVILEALRAEAASLKVIDTDILRCHPDITDSLSLDESGKPDPTSIREAVRAIKRAVTEPIPRERFFQDESSGICRGGKIFARIYPDQPQGRAESFQES